MTNEAKADPARVSAKGRQAGDYDPPVLSPAKGGPIPKWNGAAEPKPDEPGAA